MNGRARRLMWNSILGATIVVAACGSDGAAGPAGAPGATGTAGTAGPPGPPGSSTDGGTSSNEDASTLIVPLSERAQRGLSITPVPLALQGKTAAQIEEIGIGSYLVNAAADCSGCHTPAPNKYLAGGVVFP